MRKILTILTILLLVQFSGDVFADQSIEDQLTIEEQLALLHKILNPTCSGDCENGEGTKRTSIGYKCYREPCTVINSAVFGMYEGSWKGGSPNGQGTFRDEDGDRYMGQFKNGKKDGQGTYIFGRESNIEGSEYTGEFKDDNQHGQGTFTWTNGDQYVGEFKDGNRTGQATYTWASGGKHVGEWKDGNRNGQGIFTSASGTTKTGIWEDDKYIGTVAAVKRMKEEEAKKREAERKQREAEYQRQEEAEKKAKKIFNACILDKGSDVDMKVRSLQEAVEEICEAIALDPSWWQSWKYE